MIGNKPRLATAMVMLTLFAILSGCAARGKPALAQKLPLTDANLKIVGKACHINGIGLMGPKLIRMSGLSTIGKEPDRKKQQACLARKIEMPEGDGITFVVG